MCIRDRPTPIEEPVVQNVVEEQPQEQVQVQQAVATEEQQAKEQQYVQETTFEAKPSLWQRFKNSKFVRAIKAITKIRIVLDYSEALPEGRGENNQ